MTSRRTLPASEIATRAATISRAANINLDMMMLLFSLYVSFWTHWSQCVDPLSRLFFSVHSQLSFTKSIRSHPVAFGRFGLRCLNGVEDKTLHCIYTTRWVCVCVTPASLKKVFFRLLRGLGKEAHTWPPLKVNCHFSTFIVKLTFHHPPPSLSNREKMLTSAFTHTSKWQVMATYWIWRFRGDSCFSFTHDVATCACSPLTQFITPQTLSDAILMELDQEFALESVLLSPPTSQFCYPTQPIFWAMMR